MKDAGGVVRERLIVASVAFAIRAFYFWESSRTASFELPLVDAETFDSLARAFADGQALSPQDLFFHGVGYPVLLGLIYRVFGSSIAGAKALQLGFGVITALLTYDLGRRVIDRKVGTLAGLFVALYGPLIFLEGELLDAGWTALFAVGLVVLTLYASETRRWWSGLAWGLLAGSSILVRATFLPFCILALVWMIAKTRTELPHRYTWLIAAGGSLAALLIWAAVEALGSTGHFSFLPSSAGLNLHLGNNPDSCRSLSTRPGFDWNLIVRAPEKAGVEGIWNKSDWFFHKVMGYMVQSPGSFAAGLLRKTAALFVSREVPRNLDVYMLRDSSLILQAGVWKVGSFGFPFGALLPIAVVGAVTERRRISAPFWMMLASYAAVLVLVFVVGRYRIALVPLLAVLAAKGALTLVRAVEARDRKRLIRAATLAVVALMCTAAPWRLCAEQVDLRPEFQYLVGAAHLRRGNPDSAERHFRNALVLHPQYFEARHDLGRLLRSARRFHEAARELRIAATQRPDHVPLLLDLAVALGQAGELDEAVEVLEAARKLDPTNAAVYNNLGMAWVSKRHFSRASEAFRTAVELDPISPTYRQNLQRAIQDARR